MSVNDSPSEGGKIDGMLMLVAVGLLTTPIMLLLQMLGTTVMAERVALGVLLVVTIAVIAAYFSRKSWVPSAVSAFVLVPVVVALIAMWFHRETPPRDLAIALMPWFAAVVWIPVYFSRTPRVKTVFTH